MTAPKTFGGWLAMITKILATALAALTAIKSVSDAGSSE